MASKGKKVSTSVVARLAELEATARELGRTLRRVDADVNRVASEATSYGLLLERVEQRLSEVHELLQKHCAEERSDGRAL